MTDENNQSKKEYLVLNVTDGIIASHDLMTYEEAEAFIKSFWKRFEHQGYYLTSSRERISPDDVELKIIKDITEYESKSELQMALESYVRHWQRVYWKSGGDYDRANMTVFNDVLRDLDALGSNVKPKHISD